MELSILDRLLLLNLLPEKGNVVTIKQVSKLRESLSFSEEEQETFGLRQEGNQYHWNPEYRDATKDITISPKQREVITNELQALSDANAVTEQYLRLWSLFMDAE